MSYILVTGGAGYIGSHAVRMFINNGFSVVVIDNLSKGYRKAVDERAVFIEMDLGNSGALKKLFKAYDFDAVIHFAGSIEVGLSMAEPVLFFKNNCLNGLNILEAMRYAGVRKIIFSSTAAVYGNPVQVPIRESAALEPTNFYGFSKLVFEQLLEKFAQLYDFKYVSLRYFNAAGADMSAQIGQAYSPDTHLIPKMLKVVLGVYDVLKIYGADYDTPDGTCVRDYIHVSDLADAHVRALQYLVDNGSSVVLNLGNGRGFSVKEVLRFAEKVTGKKVNVELAPRRQGDPAVLIADPAKAKNILGWKPLCSSLEDILGSAWKWHSSHPNGYSTLY